MTPAHLHLVLNHFPIIGFVFAFGFILISIRKKTLQEVALVFTMIVAFLSLPAYFTGEGAEETLEVLNLASGNVHGLIENHEKVAKIALVLSFFTGLSALVSWFQLKRKRQGRPFWMTLTLVAITLAAMLVVGNLGGKIRHSETDPTVTDQKALEKVLKDSIEND